MTACTVCDAESYSTTPCTNTTNRVCSACAARCTADEYEDVACTLHSDRVCKPLQKNLTVSFAMAAPIQNVSEVNLTGYAAATAASLKIDPQYVTATLTPPENSLAARRRLLWFRRLLQTNVNIYFIISIPTQNVTAVLANSTVRIENATANATEAAVANVTAALIPNITAIAEAVVAAIKAPEFNTTITEVLAQAQLVVAVVDTATVVSAVVKEAPPNCPTGYYCIGSDYFQCASPCAPGTYQTRACSATANQVCSPCGSGSFCLGGLHKATCASNCSAGDI
jgi:hypothetical protein